MSAAASVHPSFHCDEIYRPNDVGILALEVYFPHSKVRLLFDKPKKVLVPSLNLKS